MHSLVPLLFLALCASSVNSALVLSRLYGNYMVLQRGRDNCITGQTNANTVVTLAVTNPFVSQSNNVTYTNTSSNIGDFRVCIPSTLFNIYKYTNFSMRISDGSTTKAMSDVTFGDVWLCGGQSNMAFHVGDCFDNDTVLNDIRPDSVRIFYSHMQHFDAPQETVQGAWVPSSDSSLSTFSAVCYAFGIQAYKTTGVPVGLMGSYWSGTNIWSWTSKASVEPCGYTLPAGANEKTPEGLYNGMIYPMRNFSFAGFIWYQGEDDVYTPNAYECWFPKMINHWRSLFQVPQAPFAFVQLATYLQPEGVTSSFDVQRYAQYNGSYGMANVYHTTAIDIADPFSPFTSSIHARNKTVIGQRLFRQLSSDYYGLSVSPTAGPTVSSCCNAIDNSTKTQTFRVTFDNVETLTHINVPFCRQVNASMEQGKGLLHSCCDNGPFDLTGIPIGGTFAQRKLFNVSSFSYSGNTAIINFNLSTLPANYTILEVRHAAASFPQCVLYNAALPSLLPAYGFNITCPSTCGTQPTTGPNPTSSPSSPTPSSSPSSPTPSPSPSSPSPSSSTASASSANIPIASGAAEHIANMLSISAFLLLIIFV